MVASWADATHLYFAIKQSQSFWTHSPRSAQLLEEDRRRRRPPVGKERIPRNLPDLRASASRLQSLGVAASHGVESEQGLATPLLEDGEQAPPEAAAPR